MNTIRTDGCDEAETALDVVIVGGGPAGLSAALVLGRSRRRVLILDAGEPRNAPSAAAHGFFSRDGVKPEELLRIGREQLRPYESVEYREARVVSVRGSDGAFEVVLENGESLSARKLLLASGVSDELPETPGFREFWGRGIVHCPYCHGWEMRDRPLAVLNSGEMAAEHAAMVRNWSPDLVLLTDGSPGPDEEGRRRLCALGVLVEEKKISHLEGDAENRTLHQVVFEDGSSLDREAIFYGPPQRQGAGLAEMLGCEIESVGPAPAVVKSDPLTRETTVPGVYVAGDAGSPVQSVIFAAASGANAAYFMNHALVAEEFAAAGEQRIAT